MKNHQRCLCQWKNERERFFSRNFMNFMVCLHSNSGNGEINDDFSVIICVFG